MEQDPSGGMREPHRLRRSSRERLWAGVAGGMAEYFDVDPVLARLVWIIATVLTAGLAVPVYFVLWIIMPVDDTPFAADARQTYQNVSMNAGPAPEPEAEARWQGDPSWSRKEWRRWERHSRRGGGRQSRSAGLILIALGAIFLANQAGIFRAINWGVAWAVVLVVLGAALLMRNMDWRP